MVDTVIVKTQEKACQSLQDRLGEEIVGSLRPITMVEAIGHPGTCYSIKEKVFYKK